MTTADNTGADRPINHWRLNNLRRILRLLADDERAALGSLCDAILAELTGMTPKRAADARSAGKKPWNPRDTLRRQLKHPGRTFSDHTAERVELGCRRLVREGKLPPMYAEVGILDHAVANPNVAYVLASVHVPAWRALCAELEAIPEVMEASLVYGSTDVDAIIKIEGSTDRINQIMMHNIQPLRYVLNTQTLQSVSYARWQREQKAWALDPEMFERDEAQRIREIGAGELDAREIAKTISGIEELVCPTAVKKMFLREVHSKRDALEEMKEGSLVVKRSDSLTQFPANLVATATRRIDAVVVVKDIAEGECDRILRYLDAQEARIRQTKGAFEVRRIFVVDGVDALRNDESLHGRLGAELHRKVDVQWLVASKWSKARVTAHPSDMGILDDTVCWFVQREANQERLRHVRISLQASDLLRYDEDYDLLWELARPLDSDLIRICKAAREAFEFRCGRDAPR